jgi:NodT family efflux transporter outer membrane factor (OMF) lipoprotein
MNVRIIQILLLTSAIVLLGSCGIYNSYSRPYTGIRTDSLYRDVNAAGDTANSRNLGWRKLFTDPALQSLIEKGLENNTDLQSARLRVSQAEAALTVARLSCLPSFNFAAEGVASRFKSSNTYTYTLPVVASWEVDIFGRIRNAGQRAKAAYGQSREYEQAVQTGLIASIANTYYTLLMLDSQLEISEATAKSWKENATTMEVLMEGGMANEAAVSQTQANYYAIEASLFDLKRQIYEVENSLSVLSGDTPSQIQRGKLSGQTLPEQLAAGIPVQLLSNRPDVKSAELQLQQAFYATAEARSAFYPSLVLNGTAGWTNTAGSFITNPGSLLLAVAGSLTQPIFNKGALRANLKISKAQQEQAWLAFRQSLLNAGAEVINALKQVETARSKAAYRQMQKASLERAIESTALLMQHGSSTYLEVLTARQSLLSVQLTGVADRFEELQGIVNLYHALGGGRNK